MNNGWVCDDYEFKKLWDHLDIICNWWQVNLICFCAPKLQVKNWADKWHCAYITHTPCWTNSQMALQTKDWALLYDLHLLLQLFLILYKYLHVCSLAFKNNSARDRERERKRARRETETWVIYISYEHANCVMGHYHFQALVNESSSQAIS